MKRLAPLLLTPLLAIAAPGNFQQLGRVEFGDYPSETRAALVARDSEVGLGAPGSTARYLATPGELRFTLSVDPAKPTFVTFRMWGGDVVGATVETARGPITLGAPRVDLVVEGNPWDVADYEVMTAEPLLPGRFFYRTIRLPKKATHGKSKIELILKPAQQIGGGYVKVGGPPPTAVPQNVYSRGYYEAITHTGNFFPPDAKLPDPAHVPLAAPAPLDFPLLRQRLIAGVDLAAEELMKRQLFGPQFEAVAQRLGLPPAVDGLFHKAGLAAYLDLAEKKTPDLLTPVTGSGSGRSHSGAGLVFMRVYGQPDSRFYQDPGMPARTIALLDGYRRYQGANGAWEIGGGSDGWIGGPARKDASGGLQGFFVAGLARSFLAVWPFVKDDPLVLDAKIDGDGDGRLDVTRREAWTAMFREYLEGQLGQPGGVANQAQANALGGAMAYRALQALSPRDVTGRKELAALVAAATGLAPHPKKVWMITDAGVSLEGPGFCPAYGQHPLGSFPNLIEAYADPRLRGQFAKVLDLFSYMVFPRDGAKGGPLLVSGPEGSRHRPFPGKEFDWLALAPAAVQMCDPFAGWAFGYMARFSRNLEVSPLTPDRGVHLLALASEALNALDVLPELEKALARPAVKNYVPPSAAPGWRNRNDAQVGLVMVHAGARTLYLQHVFDGRFQFIDAATQAFGSYDFEEKDGVRVILFGPWLVAQNVTATARLGEETGREARLATLPAVAEARDLVSGKLVKLDRPLALPAKTTVIFNLAALGYPKLQTVRP